MTFWDLLDSRPVLGCLLFLVAAVIASGALSGFARGGGLGLFARTTIVQNTPHKEDAEDAE